MEEKSEEEVEEHTVELSTVVELERKRTPERLRLSGSAPWSCCPWARALQLPPAELEMPGLPPVRCTRVRAVIRTFIMLVGWAKPALGAVHASPRDQSFAERY
ncbi:hypothetical protein HPB50_015003 [Hyalomma asiaticum]|uniref:Uncharacterized protein n=1 Tax=Hyalomma asiaticum TaxID=266040 RepID=A0ACB7SMY4_HYAAI|nr:hypothetical protein HPB50_015003 [Hyalomma asiaticum]